MCDSPAEADAYKRWYQEFAQGIGNHSVVLFYEIDALITAPCLSHAGLKTRIDELRSAIATLSALPHAVVYVDAGAGDAHDKGFMARMLRWVGVERIQGFFTNSTHQDWTRKEIRYARWLVRRLGGDAALRGQHGRERARAADPQEPRAARQLVPLQRARPRARPETDVRRAGAVPQPRRPLLDRQPRPLGRQMRELRRNAPPTGSFWLDYALELIRNADFRIT